MAKQAAGGLSKHAKGYRLTIGKTDKGTPRTFWLGQNLTVASHHADMLRAQFMYKLKPEGRDVWTDEDLKNVNWQVGYFKRSMAKDMADHAEALQQHQEDAHVLAAEAEQIKTNWNVETATAEAPEAKEKPTATPTLHAMLDRYAAWFAAKADRSNSSKARLQSIVDVAKKTHKNIDVPKIDRIWLDEMIQHWKNRPPHRRTKKPISTYTVKTVLQHLSSFFNWMSDNDEATQFTEPKKMAKLFKYRAAQIDTIDQLTMADLKTLYQAGSDQQRLYMLAGLTCGMTQQELSSATKDEFKFATDADGVTTGTWKHTRHKTKVPGSHWLCPQFAQLLKERIKSTPATTDNHAFLTQDGNTLVTFNGNKKLTDSVGLAWGDLLDKVELTRGRPSFKMLRKFLGGWMKDNHSDELAQVALQHKSQSVLNRHYAKQRNFEPLHAAQQQLYAELKTAGMFEPKPEADAA